MTITGKLRIAIAVLLGCGLALLGWRASPLLRTATGSVSSSLCAAAFVSGLDPDRVYREEQLPNAGMAKVAWALRYTVDRSRREVRATVLGGFASRAVFREGFGCRLIHGDRPDAIDSASSSAVQTAVDTPPPPPLAEAIDPRLSKALDAAFFETDVRALRQTKAVVVLRDGRLIAERYAAGYNVDTPIWGHSLTKSVTSALIGILVRDGKLKVDQAAPVAAWRASSDPRHDVTVDDLLRMESGLPFDETDAIITPATRMWMLEPDSATFAARQPLVAQPGTQWGYSNLSYALLSGVVRDAVGGDAANTLAFLRRELFQPLGMQHATLEFDSAGTPVGSGFMFASARDWARFGQLYLDDGVANSRRILPEGWSQYSATRTLDTGYGAGFWTNLKKDGEIPYWGAQWGMASLPDDMYFGRGALGQFIVIVPSARLVVVRLGLTHYASTGIEKLTASILRVLASPPGAPL
jgi:CubicO group peptidase (beta-lactamase class C family)